MRKIDIFDTTLRDGEQAIASGVGSLSVADKFTIASLLAEAGFDVIEAGFPKSSGGDFEAVRYIAQNIQTSEIAALSRTLDEDIERVRKTIFTRGLWDDASKYPDEVKEKEVEWVISFNNHIKKETEKYGFPVVRVGNRSDYLKKIIRLIKS